MSTSLLTGPRWVVVRQHRRALWTAVGLTAVGTATLTALRTWFVTADTSEEPTRAHALLAPVLDHSSTAIMLVPLLVAVFMAGPAVAHELESGTHRLAWTQSVSPARWLAAKLAVAAVVVVAGTALGSMVYRWAWKPVRDTMYIQLWDAPLYASVGTTTVAYGLLAVALGALGGLLVRRTFVAMGAAGLATGSVMVTLGMLREHLWPPVMATGNDLPESTGSWWLAFGKLTASGERVYWEDCSSRIPEQDSEQCMLQKGAVTDFVIHHPASHFWPIQLVETGIVLALAALATVLAFRVLRRHHA